MYGNLSVDQFGPKLLKSVQQAMVDDGLARSTINARINRIRRVFKWGVSERIVPESTLRGLQTVAGLQAGRTAAKETAPVEPVSELRIHAVKPYVSRPVWGLIQFMLFTGARPGEAVRLRWCDIDAEEDVWVYRPGRHKTEHHGKNRIIMIGPKAQAVLHTFGGRDTDHVFNPQEGMDDHAMEHYRDTATTREVNDYYSTQSFRTAVLVACERAFDCLQQLANRIGIEIRVAHYPPYCSKYNPIERRFVPHLGRACRGMLFDTLDTVVCLMRRAATSTGLTTTVNVIR
jgi:integrase